MRRPMGQFEVLQRTSDGYFDGNALLSQWKKNNPTNRDTVSNFINQKKVQEFLSELEGELGNIAQSQKWVMADLQSIKFIKGRNTKNGRTKDQAWMHPYLFIKFAMWINPKFELQVIKFVYDELIKNRHLAGDKYKSLMSSIGRLPDADYAEVAKALNFIIFNKHYAGIRNGATERELQELHELEDKLAMLIDMEYVNNQQELIMAMRKIYDNKYRKF